MVNHDIKKVNLQVKAQSTENFVNYFNQTNLKHLLSRTKPSTELSFTISSNLRPITLLKIKLTGLKRFAQLDIDRGWKL